MAGRTKRLSNICLLASSLIACGESPPPAGADRIVPDGPGTVLPGAVGDPAFRVTPMMDDAASPVAAALPDGRIVYAAVDPARGWPVLVSDAGVRSAFPGTGSGAESVALIGSRDGTLHAVWDAAGALYYANLAGDGSGDAERLVEREAKDPNVAIGPAGRVVVAYTRYEDERPVGVVALSREEDEFSAPVEVLPDCCHDELYGNDAEAISGASLVVDAEGFAHVVFEWAALGRAAIEYVRETRDGWSAPVRISDVAYLPCPALYVDGDGAHITYIEERSPSVLYRRVRDGAVTEPELLYAPEAGWTRMALMTRDAAQALLLVVQEQVGGAERLVFLRRPGGSEDPALIASRAPPSHVTLTPRAGGLTVAPDGRLLLPWLAYESAGDEGGRAEVAIGED